MGLKQVPWDPVTSMHSATPALRLEVQSLGYAHAQYGAHGAHYLVVNPAAPVRMRDPPALSCCSVAHYLATATGRWDPIHPELRTAHSRGTGTTEAVEVIQASFTCKILDMGEGDRAPGSGERALSDCGHFTRIPGRAAAANRSARKRRSGQWAGR